MGQYTNFAANDGAGPEPEFYAAARARALHDLQADGVIPLLVDGGMLTRMDPAGRYGTQSEHRAESMREAEIKAAIMDAQRKQTENKGRAFGVIGYMIHGDLVFELQKLGRQMELFQDSEMTREPWIIAAGKGPLPYGGALGAFMALSSSRPIFSDMERRAAPALERVLAIMGAARAQAEAEKAGSPPSEIARRAQAIARAAAPDPLRELLAPDVYVFTSNYLRAAVNLINLALGRIDIYKDPGRADWEKVLPLAPCIGALNPGGGDKIGIQLFNGEPAPGEMCNAAAVVNGLRARTMDKIRRLNGMATGRAGGQSPEAPEAPAAPEVTRGRHSVAVIHGRAIDHEHPKRAVTKIKNAFSERGHIRARSGGELHNGPEILGFSESALVMEVGDMFRSLAPTYERAGGVISCARPRQSLQAGPTSEFAEAIRAALQRGGLKGGVRVKNWPALPGSKSKRTRSGYIRAAVGKLFLEPGAEWRAAEIRLISEQGRGAVLTISTPARLRRGEPPARYEYGQVTAGRAYSFTWTAEETPESPEAL